ncbi:MAG: hypothetical protein ATN31_03970 [Candidatus Epulonipiscioides saccharophilum]|nr:MAG: hypothetical protein ATN31_03970 [Epulopiscium sp. AS2M-Bin001]
MRIRLIISILYLILGIMSVYTSVMIFFVPMFTVPLVKFHLGSKLTQEYIFLDFTIGLLMYFLSNTLIAPIIYITLIIMPAYSIIRAQEKKLVNNPSLILVTGTIIWGGLLLQGQLLVRYGYSYYEEYKIMIEQFLKPIKEDPNYLIFHQGIEELFISLYPSTLFMSALLMGLLAVMVNRRRKQLRLVMDQLLSFRLSKGILLLALVAIVMLTMNEIQYATEVGANLLFIIFILFYISGLFGIISYVTKLSLSTTTKLVCIVLMVLLLPVVPILPLLYGFFDTIFNFRRVELVI